MQIRDLNESHLTAKEKTLVPWFNDWFNEDTDESLALEITRVITYST